MNLVKTNGNGEYSPPALLGPESTADTAASPHGLWAILRRRKRLIAAIMVLIMGVTGLALWMATPVYTASAVMQLDEAFGVAPATNMERDAPVREREQQEDYAIRVQLEALKSRNVARKVVADLELHRNPEFNTSLADQDLAPVPEPVVAAAPARVEPASLDAASIEGEAAAQDAAVEEVPAAPELAGVPARIVESTIDKLLENVAVEQAGTSNYIVITAQSHDPEMAMRIANSVVENYTESRTEELAQTNSRLLADLEQRTEELSDRLEQAEYRVADYRRQHNIDASFAVGASAAEIQGAAAAISAARAESAQASALAAGQRAAGSASSALLNDLRNREAALESQLANLSTQYGRMHPDVMRVSAELAEVRQAVVSEGIRAAANAEATRSAANARAGQIAADLGRLRAQARSQDIVGPELAGLEREVETSNNLYLGMLERVTELRIQQANPKPEALPVSSAIQPAEPSFPKPKQTLAIAFVASVILGMLMAMVAEAFDNKLRSGDQFRRVTGLPTFAMIPQRGTVPNQVRGKEGELLSPMSVFAEAMRDGFLETILATSSKNNRIITVTSALPGEGKSTVTLGMGASAIEQGMKAIVLDFDFRKRGLTRMLGLADHEVGLDSYLSGEVDLDDAISQSPKVPKLDVLTATRLPDHPSAMFEDRKLQELFALLRERYDIVLVDTPPVMALRDAKILATYSDATVATARWGKSTTATLKPVMQMLSNSLIGLIVTRVDYAKHSRLAYSDSLEYYSKYSHYYGSGEEEEELGFFQRLLNSIRARRTVSPA